MNHTILLKKLTQYGIRGVANTWLQSFLEDRKQFTSVQGSESAEKPIKYGVPQGSVLGPIKLRLYYLNPERRKSLSSLISVSLVKKSSNQVQDHLQ